MNHYINAPSNHKTLCWKVFGSKHIKTFIEICTEFNQSILHNVLMIHATICFVPKKMGYDGIKGIWQVNNRSSIRKNKNILLLTLTPGDWHVRMKKNSCCFFLLFSAFKRTLISKNNTSVPSPTDFLYQLKTV